MSEQRDIAEEYTTERVLSSSPQCTVHEATRTADGQEVVLKQIAPISGADPRLGRREFTRAMGALQFLRPSGFPVVHDFGFTDDGGAFIAMERISGVSLGSLVGGPPERVIQIVLQVAATLEVLARGDVYHRNLSPDNVIVVETPGGDEAKVVGFGTAAFLEEGRHGALLGHSPDADRFTAPERFDTDSDPVGVESDLYSLCLVTCELLGATVRGLGSATPEVELPTGVCTQLQRTDELEEVLATGLRSNPAERRVTYPRLGEALFAALPPTAFGGTPTPEAPAAGGAEFDPNKTDPTFDPTAVGAPAAEASAVAAAQSELPLEPMVPPAPRDAVRTPWVLVGVAVGSVVVLVLTTVITGSLRIRGAARTPAPAAAEAVPAARPTPLPRPTAVPSPSPRQHPLLAEAESALAANDLVAVEAALDGISDDDVDRLSEADRDLYDRALEAVAGASIENSIRDLRGGLEIGSIRMLRRGVAGLRGVSAAELDEVSGLADDLSHAREALRLHAVMWEAHDDGDHPAVLEAAAAMIGSLSEYSTPYQFRDQSALAIEAQAEGAASSGRFETALEVLAPIQEHYPGRDGLDDRLERYRGQLAQQRELGPLLDRAAAEGAAGRPEAGLEMLADSEPVAGLERRFREVHSGLEQRLAELDAAPPEVSLAPGVALEFKKNEDVSLPVLVADDHRVVAVRAMMRSGEASEFKPLPVREDGDGRFTLEIPVALHGNESLAVYVEAEDVSGHVGRLGSSAEPVVVERKGFFKRIFGG